MGSSSTRLRAIVAGRCSSSWHGRLLLAVVRARGPFCRPHRNNITEMVNLHNRKPAMGCDIFDFHLYRGFSSCCFCVLARCLRACDATRWCSSACRGRASPCSSACCHALKPVGLSFPRRYWSPASCCCTAGLSQDSASVHQRSTMPVVLVFELANTFLQLALLTLRRRVLLDLLLIHYLIDDCVLTDGCQALAVRREGHGADTCLRFHRLS